VKDRRCDKCGKVIEGDPLECWKNRSRTYLAIAEAMAEQWGNLVSNEENTD
jgi:hypothetical protein